MSCNLTINNIIFYLTLNERLFFRFCFGNNTKKDLFQYESFVSKIHEEVMNPFLFHFFYKFLIDFLTS